MASADIAGGGVGLVGIGGGGGSGGGVGDVPPSPTLYVQNLTEKVRKAALKTSLYAIFSPFGRVVQIVHCRSKELRGQAWVVFGDVASATAAMAKMQSYPLFDKPMVRVQRLAMIQISVAGYFPTFFLPPSLSSSMAHTL